MTHIETDQEGKILYQTAEDGSLRIWDSKNLSPIDQLPSGSNHAQWHCSISPFFPSLVMTAGGGNLGDGCEIGVGKMIGFKINTILWQLWDIRQRKLVQQFRGHESDIRSAIFLHQQQVTWKRLILRWMNIHGILYQFHPLYLIKCQRRSDSKTLGHEQWKWVPFFEDSPKQFPLPSKDVFGRKQFRLNWILALDFRMEVWSLVVERQLYASWDCWSKPVDHSSIVHQSNNQLGNNRIFTNLLLIFILPQSNQNCHLC